MLSENQSKTTAADYGVNYRSGIVLTRGDVTRSNPAFNLLSFKKLNKLSRKSCIFGAMAYEGVH